MRRRRGRAAWTTRMLATLALCGLTVAGSAGAASDGYEIWFSGRVLSVDRPHGLVRILRGPTETSEAGIEDCVLRNRSLRAIAPGMDVRAEADTRRHPWRILHLRIYRRTKTRPGERAAVAVHPRPRSTFGSLRPA